MHPHTETLLYQAARAQIVEEVLKPRLNLGEIIILDRFFDSTIAYQGFGHQQDLHSLSPLINYATGGLVPDATVLFDVEAETGLSRRSKGEEWNRMDALTIDFHRRVNAAYREMAKVEPNRWVVINANNKIETVQQDFVHEVLDKLAFVGFIEGGGRNIER